MNLTALKNKPTIIYSNGVYTDLSENIFSTDLIFEYILGLEIVDETTEGRIDLIALKWYNDKANIGMILKCNNIFNPYSIKNEDLLIIPAIKTPETIIKKIGFITKSEVVQQYVDQTKMTQQDISRLKSILDKTKDKKNRLQNPLPPNLRIPGTNTKTYKDGKINLTK